MGLEQGVNETTARGGKKKRKGVWQTLTYPLPIRGQSVECLLCTLSHTQAVANEYLKQGYNRLILQSLRDSGKKAYKILEPLLPRPAGLPSRVNRGILEVTGRTLRAISDRQYLFEQLLSLDMAVTQWDYRALIADRDLYKKSQYVANLREQTLNYIAKHGIPPEDFFQLQPSPRLHRSIISYAPDDGQALRLRPCQDGVRLALKVLGDEDQWQWITVDVPLPKHLRSASTAAPDLRLACVHGRWLPVLDYKIERPCVPYQRSQYFLTVDWGVRKLVSVCVFDRQGRQVTPPMFLNLRPLQKKLLRIRREIDHLKSHRDKQPARSGLWRKYNREIARRWRRFRAIDRAMAHLASGFITLIAQLYNCSDIYVEWLKSLKSKDKTRQRNWCINTTVRQAIYDRLAYKARLVGIKLHKPLPPGGTSQYCPRCGRKGKTVKAPDKPWQCKGGGWFVCECGFNADRDYVATCNLARKALYGNKLKDQHKGVVYQKTPISDQPYCQSNAQLWERLSHLLNGFRKAAFVNPKPRIFAGLLRA